MSSIAPILVVIIWVAVIGSFSKKAKAAKKGETFKRPAEFTPVKSQQSAARVTPKSIKHIPPAARVPAQTKRYGSVSLKDATGNLLLEDRNNDWLAKQVREERKILLRSDILDLGAAHEQACQADQLKKYHILEHDDSIDTAEG